MYSEIYKSFKASSTERNLTAITDGWGPVYSTVSHFNSNLLCADRWGLHVILTGSQNSAWTFGPRPGPQVYAPGGVYCAGKAFGPTRHRLKVIHYTTNCRIFRHSTRH